MKTKVIWVPPPPSQGLVSMRRYHCELWSAFRGSEESIKFEIENFRAPEFGRAIRRERSVRLLEKYLLYPLELGLVRDAQIAHGLAHDAGRYFSLLPGSTKKVVTVHDVIPLDDPGSLTQGQLSRFRKDLEKLEHFDSVICVSEYTRKRLFHHIPNIGRSLVNPNGVEFFRLQNPQSLPKDVERFFSEPVILSISSVDLRKNLSILPSVFRRLRDVVPSVVLFRVGPKLTPPLAAELRNILGENFHEFGYATEDELISFYQHASALFFPSWFEGFGLPVLEAFAAGCPVASSNTSSLPEVGGPLAEYFDPHNADEGAQALLACVESDSSDAPLRKAWAKKHSWHRHVRNLLDEYEYLLCT